LTISAVGGCRSLPRDFSRPEPTYALAPATEGALAEFASASADRLGTRKSGFILLHRNDEAFRWRLALVDSAKHSLDLQTFLWRGDFSGRLLISRMKQAADRGVRVRLLVDDFVIVRVRLLVDDFVMRRQDRVIATLDNHPNIQIRIWNPGRKRQLGRNLSYLARLRELNHRFHNKALIADNRVVISGGRNISNEYLGISDTYNIFDLDLLVVGPVVPRVSKMFDRYWDSSQAVPASIFYKRASVEDLPEVMAQRRRLLEASPLRKIFPLDPQRWHDLFADGARALIPGEAEVIYDKPGERAPSQDAFFGLKRFFRQAENEVLVASPYLVPGDPFFVEARRMKEQGVHVAIMTNSLGSTDQTIVHAAYARTRRPLLAAGVNVFEMRYDAAMQADLDTSPVQSEWVGLHAKAAVLDRRHVFIGSFNLSPRSKNLNTEMGIFVHSQVLGAQVASILAKAMSPENSWRLRLDKDGRLAWESSDGTLTRQPAQNFLRRFKSGIFGLFPLEQHL
jgi:putative cardiolipin synthase